MQAQSSGRRSFARPARAGREIVIPAPRNRALVVLVPVWLGLWSIGIAGAAGEVVSGRARGGEVAFFALWVMGAVLGAGVVVSAWLWNAIGREVVGLRPDALVIRRGVPGFGVRREYRLADVRNLRVSLPPPDAGRWAPPLRFAGDAGVIAFDFGARTVRFGRGLDAAEARLVLAELAVGAGIERPAA